MDDHAFCRTQLRLVMDDVRKVATPEQRKAAWAYKYKRSQDAEFHGPDGYYWNGRACCTWHARAQGWSAWMNSRKEANEDSKDDT